ncbi:PIN domain-containing protein [Streptomyces sp. NPDC018057]|uniref:PIN domain-containing protein n=1 Tax=unclassified Streptomyces TaxID=2593676 RepID=UPI0037B2F315
MIVFDTSALFGLSPDDSKFDLLRALLRSGQQRVAIPWMVQEELVAQRVLNHAEAHKKAVAATSGLNRTAPWRVERGPAAFDAEVAKNYWRTKYSGLFEVIETSGAVANQALMREAYCLKPANSPEAKNKGGARDAAIWLSVVDFLQNNPEESVCFVSANTSDFGDGVTYPSPMKEDIIGMEERLTHLTSFDAVVAAFSNPLEIDMEHIESVLTGLLTAEETRTSLEGSAKEILTATTSSWAGNEVQGFLSGLTPTNGYPSVRWNAWTAAPNAILRRVSDVSGHQIGEEEWYTATVDWILVGIALRPPTVVTSTAFTNATVGQVACQWRTKLLFSSKQGEVPTILQSLPPEALDPEEKADWEPLVHKGMAPMTGSAPVLALLAASLIAAFGKGKGIGPSLGPTVSG